MRATVGKRAVRSEEGLVLVLVVMSVGLRRDSSWKCTRAATRSLLNSLGVCVPARMGAMKRGHRVAQVSLKEGRVRDAERMRESWTAAQNRVQRSRVSWAVVPEMGDGGDSDKMRTKSCLEYGGNCRSRDDGVRRKPAGGDVTMKIVVKHGF